MYCIVLYNIIIVYSRFSKKQQCDIWNILYNTYYMELFSCILSSSFFISYNCTSYTILFYNIILLYHTTTSKLVWYNRCGTYCIILTGTPLLQTNRVTIILYYYDTLFTSLLGQIIFYYVSNQGCSLHNHNLIKYTILDWIGLESHYYVRCHILIKIKRTTPAPFVCLPDKYDV